MRVLVAEAVKQDLWWSVGFVVVIAIRNEEQLGRRAYPYAPVPHLDGTDEIQSLGEHLACLEATVAVFIREDHNLVEPLAGRSFRGIAIGLDDPDAPAFIPRARHRLMEVGLGGNDFDFETLWHVHLGYGPLGIAFRQAVRGIRLQVAQHGTRLQSFRLAQWFFGIKRRGIKHDQARSRDEDPMANESKKGAAHPSRLTKLRNEVKAAVF